MRSITVNLFTVPVLACRPSLSIQTHLYIKILKRMIDIVLNVKHYSVALFSFCTAVFAGSDGVQPSAGKKTRCAE